MVGCGALHVMWDDLAEVRTLAVDATWRRRRVGHALVEQLEEDADALGVNKLFCLTFEVDFFAAHGYAPVGEGIVGPDVVAELARSGDEGVAEFLDLARVKPNTLGNTRMLKVLGPALRTDGSALRTTSLSPAGRSADGPCSALRRIRAEPGGAR